ncbi:hypothetical protein BP5796_10274 [Coleophoma crateriformis]|uniref:Uncharacterized protein n=1 Tax=Coleophoma crateriformis TaxID=565419 RepID=A0A3D8QUY4_9HELO|nr:hypothetical protein BP5796_10274 [Coleophoma crateriformis]
MAFYTMDDFSLQVSHVDLPPARSHSRISSIASLFSDKSLETSYIELPSLPPKPYSASQRSFFSDKSLEVSYIDLPGPSRRSRSSTLSTRLFDNPYEPFDDDDKTPLAPRGHPERTYSQRSPPPRSVRPAYPLSISSFSSHPPSWGWDESDSEDEDEDDYDWDDERTEKQYPRYAHVFYNSLNDKPLPPLPREALEKQRLLRASLQKPLPPLPVERR